MLLLLFLSVPLSYRKKFLFTSWKKRPLSEKKGSSETSFRTAFLV